MKLKVWGDLALFTRPETKADPYSYRAIRLT
ncbi:MULTISPECIES: CRISPR-associated protein Cas5 [Planktothrix]|nr:MULTISPECIES: CRISPR-associated protein Cas5 [Planktothrix]